MTLIYVDSIGRYVERNPALACWRLTALRQYATRFDSPEQAEKAIPHVYDDCGDAWHLTPRDFSVRIV